MNGEPVRVLVQVSDPPPVRVIAATQGPSGPPGPAGQGDMSSLIYDPTGVRDNCFNLANMVGNFDAGTF